MAHRQLLTDDERRALLGIPLDPDGLARRFTLYRADQNLVAERRRDANRIGFAVQLALLRYPGIALAQLEQSVEPLVQWLAAQLEIPAAPFVGYAHRPQTMTDHARLLATTLGLRPPVNADLPMMIEAAAQAAWSTDRGQPIAAAVVAALRAARVTLPATGVIERTAIAGRARARARATDVLLTGISDEQMTGLDRLLVLDPSVSMTSFGWLKSIPTAPKADHVHELLDRLKVIRGIGLKSEIAGRIHDERLRQFVREGHASDAHQLGRYAVNRRRAILVVTILDLEERLTDAVLDMTDKLVGGFFAKARNATRRRYVASAGNVGRLMRLFHGTIDALAAAQEAKSDAFEAVDEAVGWPKLLRIRDEVKELANLADEDPLLRAADRWRTLHKFAPALIEALEFRTARAGDPMLAALKLLVELNQSGKREIPPDAPMPFRKEWRRLILETGQPSRRLYEMAILATLRDKLRSGDVWVERSSNYRRFDSYLLPTAAVPAAAAELKLPATADEWLATKGQELDRRLKHFARRLQRGDLEGVEFSDGRLIVTPVKATTTPEARAFADEIEAMMPRVRITELLHEVNRATGFASAFSNLRTGEQCEDDSALLAAILADATNLGLGRMAAASHGITRDKLVWTADAYIRPETYKAALAKIINSHHALPVAGTWGDGTTSSSDRQFFRSGKRGDAAGDVNARYGHDPGLGFYTHVSDQHGPYNVRVMSATSHEAPYVLDGLMHHGTGLRIGTHYTDTGGASDHVFILCTMLGFRFCPRLRDFPDRKFACIEPITAYKDLQPLLGRRIRADVIREHWDEILRLVASLKAGTVLLSAMLKRLAAYQRQNQLDLALQELGRIERTLFMLDWLESPQLRQLCQTGLNKSEQRHALAQVICTFKQGRIADRGQDAQQFRASGLNLAIGAIVYWNSIYMTDVLDHMRGLGRTVPDEFLAHTSPLMWEHIGFSGDFLGSVAKLCPQFCRDMIVIGLAMGRTTVVEFKGSHFEREIVLWGVRWYVAYPVSYRQLEEMMEERGVEVDHSSLNRWVLKYVPLLDKAFRARKRRVGDSWRMDETYVRIRGRWKYLYRAVDKAGNTVDFLLTAKRDRKAAFRFLYKAIGQHGAPAKITIDKSTANTAAIENYNSEHDTKIELRQVKYLNNIVEQDHRAIKRKVRPMMGFKSFWSASVTLAGIELMHMIRKGQLKVTGRLRPAQQFYSLAS